MLSRAILPIALCGLVAGCAEQADPILTHQSRMQQQTRGLALHESGDSGHAGMRGTNCPFETVFGSLTGDYDLPDDEEEVQDVGYSNQFGAETVVLIQRNLQSLHLLKKADGEYETDSQDVPGVIEGRLSDLGLVALVNDDLGCGVVWIDTGIRAEIPGCSGGFTVDPDTGTAFVVGLDNGVDRVTPGNGADPLGADGDLVIWDDVTQALYVATTGETSIRAFEADGAERWQSDVGGPIHAIEYGGAIGAALVSWETKDGNGGLTWLDGWTGDEVHSDQTPGPAPAMSVSGNGQMIAVILEDEAHFYRIRL
jgi:hypothetical protein